MVLAPHTDDGELGAGGSTSYFIEKHLNLIINKYFNNNYSQSISYLGNVKNPYKEIIFSLMDKLGGGAKELKDMKFVLKQPSKNKLNFEVSHFTLNGLWTEGFKR
ncbi:MAG: hypothetical protein P8I93_03095 [Crocinitomicaceae bacterium]|nr:hypothetical protein [Crocinitomicaceae bacterium]